MTESHNVDKRVIHFGDFRAEMPSDWKPLDAKAFRRNILTSPVYWFFHCLFAALISIVPILAAVLFSDVPPVNWICWSIAFFCAIIFLYRRVRRLWSPICAFNGPDGQSIAFIPHDLEDSKIPYDRDAYLKHQQDNDDLTVHDHGYIRAPDGNAHLWFTASRRPSRINSSPQIELTYYVYFDQPRVRVATVEVWLDAIHDEEWRDQYDAIVRSIVCEVGAVDDAHAELSSHRSTTVFAEAIERDPIAVPKQRTNKRDNPDEWWNDDWNQQPGESLELIRHPVGIWNLVLCLWVAVQVTSSTLPRFRAAEGITQKSVYGILLIGVPLMCIMLLRNWIKSRRRLRNHIRNHGRLRLNFAQFPLLPGDHVDLKIPWKLFETPNGILGTMRLIHQDATEVEFTESTASETGPVPTVSRKMSTEPQTVVLRTHYFQWTSDQIMVEPTGADAGRRSLHLNMEIPTDCTSTHLRCKQPLYWELELDFTVKQPFSSRFLLPVYSEKHPDQSQLHALETHEDADDK